MGNRVSKNNVIGVKEKFETWDSLVEHQKSVFSTNKKLTLELNRLRAKCQKEVDSLVGDQNLKAYTKLHDEIRSKFLVPTSISKPESEREQEEKLNRQQLIGRSQEFIKGLGVDKKKVEGVFRRYIKKADGSFDHYLNPKAGAPFAIADRASIPRPDQSPWHWFYPPYLVDYGDKFDYGTKGIHACTHYEDYKTGRVSTISYVEIKGASDSDYARTSASSEITIPQVFAPLDGRIEAWLTLRNDNSSYHGCMDDEWGWSNISVKQQSRPYMGIYGRGASYGTLFDFVKGECDCCWSGKISDANPGDLRFVHLVSQEPFPANLWAILSFGIFDQNYAWVNDYSVRMTMTNSWFIDSVAIRFGLP
jgi:hypothetical protein